MCIGQRAMWVAIYTSLKQSRLRLWNITIEIIWYENVNQEEKSPVSRLFTQLFFRGQIKVNIKAPRHWPLCGEFTGDW